MSKRWGKEREEGGPELSETESEEMLGTMFPIGCSGEEYEKRTHLMLPGDRPYQGGVFVGKGWTAVVSDDPPAVTFLCADCFKKEVDQQKVTSKPRSVTAPSVSG